MQLRDAAEVLGVHYQTAYAWVRQGVLPARKTGHGYDVSESDVSALAARRASGTAPRPHIRHATGRPRRTGCTRRSCPGTRPWPGTSSPGSRAACR